MKMTRRVGWVLCLLGGLGLVLTGCSKSSNQVPVEPIPKVDPYAPCTDPQTCCALEDLRCEGDGPDGRTVCTCEGLWDCSINPDKCTTEAPVPDGGGEWDCTWTEFAYSCDKEGSEDQPPVGGGDWNCTWVAQESSWHCVKTEPPNPSNKPQGTAVWDCVVDNETGQVVCEREPGDEVPPTGGGEWECKEVEGVRTCIQTDDDGGLPDGTGSWKCNRVNMGGVIVWVCYGEVPSGSPPPGGEGDWDCEKVSSGAEFDLYKCVQRDVGEQPEGSADYSCYKGTEFGGTICEEVDKPPVPVPGVGDACIPGTMVWCDGLQYCGWGQVTCLPDGTWPTREVNGLQVLDCQELESGHRPNTVCACFHFYFNASCCERPDCVVPDGSLGQICPKSEGGLCDYCNPREPECKDSSAYCVVTNSMETFCGQACGVDADCPANYRCLQ
ncbi:MAG: hypothetical protein JRH20_31480, partial [Deltaproteobacteria bacterium]|nr:hypothetical protein [Deltaproteobacteria bacterium]